VLIRTRRVIARSLAAWVEQRAASKGAALAFYTLFSMTPILVLAIALAGYFFGAQAAQGEMVEQMRTLAGPNGAQAIQALLAAAHDPASGFVATVIASVLLLVGATSVFAELKGSLDEMWGTGQRRRGSFTMLVRTRLLAFGLVLVLAFLLLISLVVSAAIALLERYAGAWASSTPAISTLSWLISFGVIASLFAVIYKMLPDVQLSWHDVWIGALVTAALFTVGKHAIGLYLGNGAVASSFGAAGSVVALLAWVYYSAQIFFLGAQFTRQYALCCGSLQVPDPRAA
jgi:membrane protein